MKSEEEIQNAIELYADMVQKICVLHMKQRADAEDVFQTVFLKYAQSAPFRDREHEKAWLLKVTMNACRERFRGWFHKHADLQTDVEACGSTHTTSTYLLDALNQLPPHYRDVLYLFYYEGYTAVEIAGILKRSENTIYTWLDRARKELKKQLGGEWDGK